MITNNDKLRVLIINDMVIFPNNEVRIEYDKNLDKQMKETFDCDDELILIVNPIDDGEKIDIMSLPNIGVLGRIKLKLNVPNGKTRVVIEGLERVEINNYTFDNKNYSANYNIIENIEIEDENNYINILIKAIERYIDRVPYIGNAIMGQINNVRSLDELCDLVASFLTIDYDRKKKYVTIVDPAERCKLLIEDINIDLQFAELEQKIEAQVEKELNETQKEYFLREKIKAMLPCILCTLLKTQPVALKAPLPALRHSLHAACHIVKALGVVHTLHKMNRIFHRKLIYKSLLLLRSHVILLWRINVWIVIKYRHLKILRERLYAVCAARSTAAMKQKTWSAVIVHAIFFY